MKKIVLTLIICILVSLSFASADSDHGSEGKGLIESKIPCDNLSEEQLESIGDYYMEQMHPGEAHEVMDEMMGGEGSETLTKMHIKLAQNFYCGDSDAMSSGMMGMMVGRSGTSNQGGMMNMMGFGTGMGWFGGSFLWILNVALAAFVFGIVFWWTYKLVVKSKKKR